MYNNILHVLSLFLSQQITVNNIYHLPFTNTKILLYCIYRQYNYSVPYHRRALFWYRHTNITFLPPAFLPEFDRLTSQRWLPSFLLILEIFFIPGQKIQQYLSVFDVDTLNK